MARQTSELVKRVEREQPLLDRFRRAGRIELNYHWEWKGDKERAYIEILMVSTCTRTGGVRVFTNPAEAKGILEEEALALITYLQGRIKGFDKTFGGYYQKGTKKEKEYNLFE